MLSLVRKRRGKKLVLVAAIWLVADFVFAPMITAYVTLPLLAELVHRYPPLAGLVSQLAGLLR